MREFVIVALASGVLAACSPGRTSTSLGGDASVSDSSTPHDSGTPRPDGAAIDAGDPSECVPQCRGRECGSNGCTATCGICFGDTACREDGQCVATGACTPTCRSRSCGDDGCGGTCGTCAGGSSCTGVEPPPGVVGNTRYLCEPASWPTSTMCPPTGTQGTAVGQVVPEMPITECGTGTPVNFRGVCTQERTIFVRVNIDCVTCIYFVNDIIAEVADEFPDVPVYIVLSSDSECSDHDYFTRDYHFTREYMPQYGFSQLFGTAGNDQVLVLHEGNRIALYKNHPTVDEIRGALTSSL